MASPSYVAMYIKFPPTSDFCFYFHTGNSLFLSSLCLVHDIPATNVTTLQDGSSTFCVVESERGVYRSVSLSKTVQENENVFSVLCMYI